ncbi:MULTISPECIES: DUF2690 domain-containing protein [Kitasatospora]|uniref:DUF2690 domain-containing protein n=1 Tax=Kitasatospora TaxID=2063 RepID=UPI0031D8D9DD
MTNAWRRVRRSAAVLGAALAMACAVPSTASASVWDDNTDPMIRCSGDARTIASLPMTPEYGGPVVTHLEVRYSPSCGTNWVRVWNPYATGTHESYLTIRRDQPGGGGKVTARLREYGYQWTYQIWAPGCIYVSAALVNLTTHRVDAGGFNQEVRVC